MSFLLDQQSCFGRIPVRKKKGLSRKPVEIPDRAFHSHQELGRHIFRCFTNVKPSRAGLGELISNDFN
jgi:hypothetical protein